MVRVDLIGLGSLVLGMLENGKLPMTSNPMDLSEIDSHKTKKSNPEGFSGLFEILDEQKPLDYDWKKQGVYLANLLDGTVGDFSEMPKIINDNRDKVLQDFFSSMKFSDDEFSSAKELLEKEKVDIYLGKLEKDPALSAKRKKTLFAAYPKKADVMTAVGFIPMMAPGYVDQDKRWEKKSQKILQALKAL